MGRYVDDNEALKIIKKMLYETALNNFTTDRKFADDCEEIAEHRLATWFSLVPTADVVEIKHGEWKHTITYYPYGKIYLEFLYPFAYPFLFSFDGLRMPSQKGTYSGAKP